MSTHKEGRTEAPRRYIPLEQATDRFLTHLVDRAGLPSYWVNVAKKRSFDDLLRNAIGGCFTGASKGRNSVEIYLQLRRAYCAVRRALERGKFTQAESAIVLALLCATLDFAAAKRGGEYAAAVIGPSKPRKTSAKN